MLTFNDFQKAINKNDKASFILKAINEYKASDLYKRAELATEYYARKNRAILKRATFLERKGIRFPVIFHRLCNGLYPKFIKRWVFYTLGNGLTLDADKKAKLGRKFEIKLLLDGVIPACNAGVSWGFWNNDHIVFFTALEAFGLFDERTGNLKALIRFWQIDKDKPMYVELFEVDGITEFASERNGGALKQIDENPRPYKTKIFKDSISETVVETEVYSELPIYPLYVNELKDSEFNDGIKSYIDAYDFVSSDQIDQILMSEGINSVVKNFGGESFQEMWEKLQGKIFPVDENAGTDVAMHVVEAPYQAKKTTLEWLERRMYADFLMADIDKLGTEVTATEIKASNEEMNNKSDILEWQTCDFVENILKINRIQYTPDEVKFKRRSVINDTEMVDNIDTMLSNGSADIQWAVENNPLITDADQEALLARLAIAEQEKANETFELEDEADEAVVVEDVNAP